MTDWWCTLPRGCQGRTRVEGLIRAILKGAVLLFTYECGCLVKCVNFGGIVGRFGALTGSCRVTDE